MFARHAHLWSRFSEFNAEDTEKCHREHSAAEPQPNKDRPYNAGYCS
jgi:hypothetical protein